MKWKKTLAPLFILGLGFLGMKAIALSGEEEASSVAVDTRPTVRITTLKPIEFQVTIESFGEVQPLESTRLSAQVSGEIVDWNPKFIAGGIVNRGEVLFRIERDSYEAALLQAEANLASAQAALIEEKALAQVAKIEAKSIPPERVTDLYLRKPQILSAESAVKSAQAQLRIAQRDLNNTEIIAPYDALIVSRTIGKGDFVSAGTQTAILNNIETAEITFPVARFDQDFLPSNLVDIPVTISMLNRDNNTIIRHGKLNRDTGIIDAATRMSHLVVRINDPYGLKSDEPILKYGSYVQISFPGITLQDVYKVPQELITQRQLWLLDDSDNLVPKKINVVREQGTDFLLSGDIEHNARAVVTLPEYPQAGMPVKVIASDDDLVATHPN
jgi:RND family efflux transporter MFP subunit